MHKILSELNKTVEHLVALYGKSTASETRVRIYEITKTIEEIAKKASNRLDQDLDEPDDESEEKTRRLDI